MRLLVVEDNAVLSELLAKGLRTEGLGQWWRYRSHLSSVLPIIEPWLKRFLYQT